MPIRLLTDALSADDQVRVLRHCSRLRFGKGAFIFHAGEAGDTVHLIETGKVAVLAGGSLGEPVMLTIMGQGEVFGEQGLLDPGHRRTATIQALTVVETMALRRDAFEELRHEHPTVDKLLIAILSQRVHRLTDAIIEFAELSAATRIYRRISQLATVFEVAGSDRPIPVTQAHVASMAAVKLRATNEVIGQARRDGVLTTARGRIVVVNWGELYRRAQLPAG